MKKTIEDKNKKEGGGGGGGRAWSLGWLLFTWVKSNKMFGNSKRLIFSEGKKNE